MNDTSQPGFEEARVPDGARPVHPDGAVDAPTGSSDQPGGSTGRVEGTGSPAEGARGASDEESSPHRSSPTEGLGASAAGGSPVREADSPVDGLGSSAADGSPVQPAESPAEGLGSPGQQVDDRDVDRPAQADPLG